MTGGKKEIAFHLRIDCAECEVGNEMELTEGDVEDYGPVIFQCPTCKKKIKVYTSVSNPY